MTRTTLLALPCLLAACGEEPVDPTWTAIETKIIVPTCATSLCHKPGTINEEFDDHKLDLTKGKGYAELVDRVVYSKDWPDKYKSWKRVDAGKPDVSALLVGLAHHADLQATKETQRLNMPQKGTLSDERIATIKTWITNGAKKD